MAFKYGYEKNGKRSWDYLEFSKVREKDDTLGG